MKQAMNKAMTLCGILALVMSWTSTAGAQEEIPGRDRDRWYIGFGVGGGSGWIGIDNGPEASAEGGVGIMFKVGAVINRHLLLGFDASAWRYQAENKDGVQFNHYDAMLTWFPLGDLGLFLKGGAGLGNTVVDYDGDTWGRSEAGMDIKVGAGWEFQLSHRFWLGAEFNYAATFYEGFSTNDAIGMLSFSWY